MEATLCALACLQAPSQKFSRDALLMLGTSGHVSPAGAWFASVISRPGRNEVQFYPLPDYGSRPVKIELSDDLPIAVCCWVAEKGAGNGDRNRKRNLGDEAVDSKPAEAHVYFVVCHESGKMCVFAPLLPTEVNSFHVEMPIVAMAAGEKALVCVDQALRVVEIAIPDGKMSKPKSFRDIASVRAVATTVDNSKKQHYILGNDDVTVVDPSKPKNFLVSRLEGLLAVLCLERSRLHPNIAYAVRENDSTLYVYDTTGGKPRTHAASGPISGVFTAVLDEQEAVFAICEAGIEVFVVDFEADFHARPPTCYIRTSGDNAALTAVSFHENRLTGIWYRGLQPQFLAIDWNFASVGEISVATGGAEGGKNPEGDEKLRNTPQLVAPPSATIANLPVDQLVRQLREHLSREDSAAVVALCVSNVHEDTIRDAVKRFSGELGADQVSQLYRTISTVVARQPDDSQVLAVWLKWVLLIHGGALAKSGDHNADFVLLQKGLSRGIDQMPQLLALQGRLQLLRAQAQLRDMEVAGPGEYAEAANEGSVVYANGEDDDEE